VAPPRRRSARIFRIELPHNNSPDANDAQRAQIEQDHQLAVVLSYDLRPNYVPRESQSGKMSVERSKLGSEVTLNQQVKEDRKPIKIAAEAVKSDAVIDQKGVKSNGSMAKHPVSSFSRAQNSSI
jgi:hypothetical protein